MIQATIIGNIGADAQVKEINGKQYCSFNVASTRTRGGQKETTWASVLYYVNDNLMPYLVKGAGVCVIGDLTAKAYQKSDGTAGIDLSLFANTLTLCGGRQEQTAPGQPQPSGTPQSDDKDLPF